MNALTLALPSEKHWLKYALPTIVILAIVVRLVGSLILTDLATEPEDDELVFTRIGWNLASGVGYSANGEDPTTWRPPAYPLLLTAIFSVVGQNWVIVRLINILLSALTIVVLYMIGAKLFNKNVGLIAALIAAVYPAFIRLSLLMYSETLYVLLVSLVLVTFVKIYDDPQSLKLKITAGVLLGLAILTRSELLFFMPFVGLWALLFYRRLLPAVRVAFIIALPAILVVLPWLIRNYIVFDRPVMATNLGFLLWGVHNPETFSDNNLMGGHHLPEFKLVKNAGEVPRERWKPELTYLPEIEWDQVQTQWALESIRENIHLMPRMLVYKLHRLVFTPGAIRDLLRFPLVYLFFFGLILMLVSGDKRFLIFYMFILFAIFITLPFYTSERLRMVLDPTFIIVASFGLSQQISLINKARQNNQLAL
jgi:4-amino-4-deoxy-L-arabinose transferase-like glycosyltransferase